MTRGTLFKLLSGSSFSGDRIPPNLHGGITLFSGTVPDIQALHQSLFTMLAVVLVTVTLRKSSTSNASRWESWLTGESSFTAFTN